MDALAFARERRVERQVGTAATTAARFELKYWATEAQATSLLRWAAGHVVVDPCVSDAAGHGWTVSLYLDSPRLNFFEQHLASAPDRLKLRVRTYAAPGRQDVPAAERGHERAYLEIKRKVGALTLKQRTTVTRADALAIAERRFDQAVCLKQALDRDLEAFMFLQERFAVRPVVVVRARRQSLNGLPEEGSFRLTLDREISYQRAVGADLDGRRRAWLAVDCPKPVLIEVKFCDAAPAWLGPAIERLGLAHNAFSKYIAAVGHELDPSATPGFSEGRRRVRAVDPLDED